jgi:hypothetical protein
MASGLRRSPAARLTSGCRLKWRIRLDRVPGGVENLRRVFMRVEHGVDAHFVEFIAHDEIGNGAIQVTGHHQCFDQE